MKVLADASLPGLASAFPPPFNVTCYQQASELATLLKEDYTVLLCRSTLKVNQALLQHSTVQIVATASSGVDHIDEQYLAAQGIQLVDAKGSNAPAVADYVLATLACLEDTYGYQGATIGIMGLGAVGSVLAARLTSLNLAIRCFDPPKAQADSQFHSCSLAELLACDVICIHANLHTNKPYPTKHLIGPQALSQLKPNSIIINASRGNIVAEAALLRLKTPLIYCTDVFANEPRISHQLVDYCQLCTPHIAGHSIEAKQAAVAFVSQKIHHYYQLTPPIYNHLVTPLAARQPNQRWQDYALQHYNPLLETRALKAAIDKEHAFLQLRKRHQQRHDFNILL